MFSRSGFLTVKLYRRGTFVSGNLLSSRVRERPYWLIRDLYANKLKLFLLMSFVPGHKNISRPGRDKTREEREYTTSVVYKPSSFGSTFRWTTFELAFQIFVLPFLHLYFLYCFSDVQIFLRWHFISILQTLHFVFWFIYPPRSKTFISF